MGTRSITTVRSSWEGGESEHNVSIYRHYDGYPEAQGQDLFRFLDGLVLVNGIGTKMPERYANGPGRLAAQLVSYLQELGVEPDLMPEGSDAGQEFHYVLDIAYGMGGGDIKVTIYSGPVTFFGMGGEECTDKIFEGSVQEYGDWLRAKA